MHRNLGDMNGMSGEHLCCRANGQSQLSVQLEDLGVRDLSVYKNDKAALHTVIKH